MANARCAFPGPVPEIVTRFYRGAPQGRCKELRVAFFKIFSRLVQTAEKDQPSDGVSASENINVENLFSVSTFLSWYNICLLGRHIAALHHPLCYYGSNREYEAGRSETASC